MGCDSILRTELGLVIFPLVLILCCRSNYVDAVDNTTSAVMIVVGDDNRNNYTSRSDKVDNQVVNSTRMKRDTSTSDRRNFLDYSDDVVSGEDQRGDRSLYIRMFNPNNFLIQNDRDQLSIYVCLM